MNWVILAPIAAVISILFGGWLFVRVQRAPLGSARTAEVTAAIAEGANAYLRVLYIALVVIAAILAILLIFLFGWQMALAFVFGATCSAVAGYFGMLVALMANGRSATAAKEGLSKAFPIAFNAGGVMGMAVVGLAKTLATEWAPEVRANVVMPGSHATERIEKLAASAHERGDFDSVEAAREAFVAGVPAGRMGDPARFGQVVAFLSGAPASYVNGAALMVDGGEAGSIL